MTGESEWSVVLEWWGAHHVQHRIRVKQIPGSAHWSVQKQSRGSGGKYTADWTTEANHKPEANPVDMEDSNGE